MLRWEGFLLSGAKPSSYLPVPIGLAFDLPILGSGGGVSGSPSVSRSWIWSRPFLRYGDAIVRSSSGLSEVLVIQGW